MEVPSTPLSPDAADQYLVELAAAARVDALVSGDRRLLRLRGSLPLMTPAEFLAGLGSEGRAGATDR